MSERLKRIHIEISNTCNLSCSFCPIDENAKQVMTAEAFAGVLAQVAGSTDEVALHLLGEPLAHPQFKHVIDACEMYGVPVNIVTNGILLSRDRIQHMLRPIVRQISFSLQSFENNFKDQDPRLYVQRIHDFVVRAETERPDLYINLRLWDLAGPGAQETSETQRTRAVLAEIFGFDWKDVTVDLRRRKNWRLRGRTYLYFDSRFEWPSMAQPVRSERGFCHGLTNHYGIHADGTVVPCCLDHEAEIPLGNAFREPIADILAGTRAKAMREGFARGELVEDLCKRCTFISRFDKRAAKMRDASPGR